jgi:hypothetical protein
MTVARPIDAMSRRANGRTSIDKLRVVTIPFCFGRAAVTQ